MSFAAYFNAFAAGYWRHWSALTAVRLHLQLRAPAASTSTAPRPTAPRSSSAAWCWTGGRAHRRPGAGPAAVRGRRLVLVRPHHRRGRPHARRGRLVRRRARPGPRGRHHRHAHVQPARRLRRHPHRHRRGPARPRRRGRRDPARPGHREGARRPGLRAGGGGARREAAHRRPAQPRRLRRLRPRDVRGARHRAASRSSTWTTTSCWSPIRCCGPSRSRGYSREPMLVGGQMLSLQARSQLSTMGEVVDRHTFLWRNAPARCRTTTSPSARCGRPTGCTAAPTSTTTPGGCA